MSDDATDDDGVLTPDELDVARDERVEELDDNRYFVSTGDDPAAGEHGNPRPDGSDDVRDAPPAENAGDERAGPFADERETDAGFDPDRVLDDAAAVEPDGRRGPDGDGGGDVAGGSDVDPIRGHDSTDSPGPSPDDRPRSTRRPTGSDGADDPRRADQPTAEDEGHGTAHPRDSGPGSRESALAGVDGQFAVAAALRTDAGVADYRFGSNNVAETFEALVRWYADRVGDGRTPTEEVVRILLAESDLEL